MAITLGRSTSPVALPATLDLPARSGSERVEGLLAPHPAHRLRWLLLAVADAAGGVLIVYLFGLAVLGSGIPIGLLSRLVAWLTRVL